MTAMNRFFVHVAVAVNDHVNDRAIANAHS